MQVNIHEMKMTLMTGVFISLSTSPRSVVTKGNDKHSISFLFEVNSGFELVTA